jgi:hypothetical protein
MLRANEFGVLVDVLNIDMDDEGHYGPSFLVRGKYSKEVVRITVGPE